VPFLAPETLTSCIASISAYFSATGLRGVLTLHDGPQEFLGFGGARLREPVQAAQRLKAAQRGASLFHRGMFEELVALATGVAAKVVG